MNDPRQAAMDMVLGGGGAPSPAEAAPEAPEGGGGMKCPVCGAQFELKAEEAPEAAGEGMEEGGM